MAYLHCTGAGVGTRTGTEDHDYWFKYIIQKCHTGPRQGQELDPLSPIVPVMFPVPVQVPVPFSVNKPQARMYWLCTRGGLANVESF